LRFLTYNSVEFQNNRLAISIAVSHADQSEFLKENNVRAESFYGVHAVEIGLGHTGQVTGCGGLVDLNEASARRLNCARKTRDLELDRVASFCAHIQLIQTVLVRVVNNRRQALLVHDTTNLRFAITPTYNL